ATASAARESSREVPTVTSHASPEAATAASGSGRRVRWQWESVIAPHHSRRAGEAARRAGGSERRSALPGRCPEGPAGGRSGRAGVGDAFGESSVRRPLLPSVPERDGRSQTRNEEQDGTGSPDG